MDKEYLKDTSFLRELDKNRNKFTYVKIISQNTYLSNKNIEFVLMYKKMRLVQNIWGDSLMQISHKIKNISGEETVYIYVTVEDIYEFGKENLGKGESSNFLKNIKEYIRKNLRDTKNKALVIVINGVIIGTITYAALIGKTDTNTNKLNNTTKPIVDVYKEETSDKEIKENIENNKQEELKEKAKEEVKEESKKDESLKNTTINSSKQNTNSNTKKTSSSNTKSNKPTSSTDTKNTSSSTSNKTQSSTTVSKSQTTTNTNTSTATDNTVTNANTQSNTNENKPNSNSGITIKFNNGGVVTNIDLEEYIIGVVAAEMPASFNIEALKAQAVAARTYAMKKHSKGITLVNSTAHQVYYSTSQMKSMWGASYDTYYNKIKNAVYSTKGQVIKYNGEYIDAVFYSMSNGKSELPSYVWNYSYPYLQVVSSPWDVNLSAAKYTVNMTYEKMSEKLGVTVNKDSEIKILSRTESDRINKISISGKTFTGVEVRTKLGLRSTDFSIVQNDDKVSITTIGFGHGVGMSQYGANGAAKAGYSYKQILSHYYPGTSVVNI